MAGSQRGRRNPIVRPDLTRLAFLGPAGVHAAYKALSLSTDAADAIADGLPAPHGSTHTFDPLDDPLPFPGEPTTINSSAASSPGVGFAPAREDHQHALDDNGVANSKLRDSAATSVIGRAAGTVGDPADIAASADGQVLKRSAGTLAFAALTPADIGVTASSKALVNATHTALFDVAVPSGGYAGGRVVVHIQVTDGVDFEAFTDVFTYSAVNKAGTVTAAVSVSPASPPAAPVASSVASAGAGLGVLYTAVAGAAKATVRVRATSSIAVPTSLVALWAAEDYGGNAITPL